MKTKNVYLALASVVMFSSCAKGLVHVPGTPGAEVTDPQATRFSALDCNVDVALESESNQSRYLDTLNGAWTQADQEMTLLPSAIDSGEYLKSSGMVFNTVGQEFGLAELYWGMNEEGLFHSATVTAATRSAIEVSQELDDSFLKGFRLVQVYDLKTLQCQTMALKVTDQQMDVYGPVSVSKRNGLKIEDFVGELKSTNTELKTYKFAKSSKK